MSSIDALLQQARQGIDRVRPEQLAEEMAKGALVVDIRPEHYRLDEGSLPGALIIERNVLEWRLDPTGPDHLPEAQSSDLRVVVFCNEGYASSLAAWSLRQIGLHRAADLEGGFRAWRAHELAASPDRS